MGSLGKFDAIRNLDSQVKEMSQRALNFLLRPRSKARIHGSAGPVLAGVFYTRSLRIFSKPISSMKTSGWRELMVLVSSSDVPELNISMEPQVPGCAAASLSLMKARPPPKPIL